MSDPILIGQMQDASPYRAEMCYPECFAMVTQWGGREVSADTEVAWTISDDGTAAIANGTSVEEGQEVATEFAIPIQTVRAPCGDAAASAASRGHCIALAVMWNGVSSLGGSSPHWVLAAPSGVICNPYGPQYDHWFHADLNTYGQGVGIEFMFTEGGLAVPRGDSTMAREMTFRHSNGTLHRMEIVGPAPAAGPLRHMVFAPADGKPEWVTVKDGMSASIELFDQRTQADGVPRATDPVILVVRGADGASDWYVNEPNNADLSGDTTAVWTKR